MPIRLRLAALVTLATAFLLGGAGLLFLQTLHSGLENSMDNSLRTAAEDVSTQLSSAGSAAGPIDLPNGTYGQLINASGVVVRYSEDHIPVPLLSSAQVAEVGQASRSTLLFDRTVTAAQARTIAGSPPVRLRVLAVPGPAAGSVIAVATSREVADEATERAAKQLLILGAISLFVAGPGAWLLARAALRPVDRLRAQAAELQAKDASGGLTVPGTRDEIARLAHTLNGMLGRLHAAVDRERAFVADAGHELRTPLTILRGELELAQRSPRTREELAETVEVAAVETDRLIRLAEDLLVLARDDNQAGLRIGRTDLAATVRDAIASVAARSQARQLTVVATGLPEDGAPLMVDADADRLRQAVENLLSNAVRFSPAGETITVAVDLPDDDVRVSVGDHGPGFAPAFLPLAFERFSRGDPARTREPGGDDPGGSGLGLAIVAGILRAHRGTATARNLADFPSPATVFEPGAVGVAGRTGAVVTLRWPRDHPDT